MDDKEKLKQELLEELKKEYTLTPIKEKQFSVSDILDKYIDDICIECGIPDTWSNKQGIFQAIRKVVCLHFKTYQLKYINPNDRVNFREETERFIKEYILN
jgi:hypothetical protein